jgi:hypothetical protein
MSVPVPNIIGLTGYAQHGKNTVAEVFEDLGYRPVAFADALREMARRLNPVIPVSAYYAWAPPQDPMRYADIVDTIGYEAAKQIPEVRRLLQVLGTECVRDIIGENAWVQALFKNVFPGERYVITDVRFPNEARAVTQAGGEVWKVTRLGFDNGLGVDHPSEAHIGKLPYHVEFVNDTTVEALQSWVKKTIGARGFA